MDEKEMTTVLEEIGLAQQPCQTGDHDSLRALMLAVFEDGIRSFLRGKASLRRDAEHWIDSPNRGIPFSFNVICETLGLDPSATKVALHRLAKEKTQYRQRNRLSFLGGQRK